MPEPITPDTPTPDPITAAVAGGDFKAFSDAANRADRGESPSSTPKAESSPAEPAAQVEPMGSSKSAASETVKPPVRDAEVRVKELLAERAQLQAELHAAKAPKPVTELKPASEPAVKADSDPEPDPTNAAKYPDGQFDRAFIKDQARWEARQEFTAQQASAFARQQQERTTQAQLTRIQAFSGRITEHLKTDPQFFETISPEVRGLKTIAKATADGEPLSPLHQVAEELVDSVLAVPIMRHFTDHPEDLARFGSLTTPRDVTREFAKLEKALETAPAVKEPPTPETLLTKPPPTPPRSTGRHVTEPVDELASAVSTNNYTTYKKLENEREMRASGVLRNR